MITEIISGCSCCRVYTGVDLDTAMEMYINGNIYMTVGYGCYSSSPNSGVFQWSGDNTGLAAYEYYYIRHLEWGPANAAITLKGYFGWYSNRPSGQIDVSIYKRNDNFNPFLWIIIDWGGFKKAGVGYTEIASKTFFTNDRQGGCATQNPVKFLIQYNVNNFIIDYQSMYIEFMQ